MKASGIAWVAAAVALAVVAWRLFTASSHQALFVDFQAFYCAGSSLLQHGDPYDARLLLRCEQTPQPLGLYTVAVVLLAPFPGYALGAFTLLARLPYVAAAAVWLALLLASAWGGCLLLSRLCAKTTAGMVATLTVAYAVAVIPYAQISPLVLCALCGTALALRYSSGVAVFAGLTVAALEPNVAFPVFLALLVWRSDLRVPLIALCGVLLGLHVAVLGPANALAYFTQILPAHDASEVRFVNQFSFTWILQALGAPVQLSLLLGNAAYAAMCGFGVWFSGALARRFGDAAFLVLIPAASAVIGGSYVHYSEVLLALPAALLLFTYSTGASRAYAFSAVILIAMPWLSIVAEPAVLVAVAGGVAAVCALTLEFNGLTSLRVALSAALLCALLLLVAFHYGPAVTAAQASVAPASGLADAARAAQIAKSGSSAGIVWWVAKLPTWVGLLLLLLSGALALANKSASSKTEFGNALLASGE